MSLIRTGLVLGAVIYMMPTDTKRQTEMIHAASDTLVWGLTYCEREPSTCDQAKVVWGEMMQKAKFGAALASDLATKWSEQQANGQPAGQVAPAKPRSIDDLIDADAATPNPGQAWDAPING